MDVQKPTVVSHFLSRAGSFLRSVNCLTELNALEGGRFAQAVGLLAVHGAIAVADAVLVAVDGTPGGGENHAQAARRLRRTCSSLGVDRQGLRHFEWLLSKKNHFSYDDRRVSEEELKEANVKMEQFFAWAFRSFPDVAQLREAEDA